MSVVPAHEAMLVCDGCRKEIKRGSTTRIVRNQTFLSIDPADNEALFHAEHRPMDWPRGREFVPGAPQFFHIGCLP